MDVLEEKLELLDDLLHDLGKYIAFPLQMLPKDATDGEFRAALDQALHVTRKGPMGVQSASDIWLNFRQECGNDIEDDEGWSDLVSAVEQALLWSELLADMKQTLDREQATADLRAVSGAIRQFRDTISD